MMQRGKELVLLIGNAGAPEAFSSINAITAISIFINNQVLDITDMDSAGVQGTRADAGLQGMQIRAEGYFRDEYADEALRTLAFSRAARNYRIIFPNGDNYTASFVIQEYGRTAEFEGLERFSLMLMRSGIGTYVAG